MKTKRSVAVTCKALACPTVEEKEKEREGWRLASLADEAPGSGVVVVCRRVGMGSRSWLLLGQSDRGVGVDSRDGLGIVAVDGCNGSHQRAGFCACGGDLLGWGGGRLLQSDGVKIVVQLLARLRLTGLG
jgi:hypothetical protein